MLNARVLRLLAILFFLSQSISLPLAMAEENLGTLRLENITLRPLFFARERDKAEFSLDNSHLTLGWTLNNAVGAKAEIGSSSQTAAPAFYNKKTSAESLVFTEAYGEFNSVYGRVRAGVLKIPFGAEGVLSDSEELFMRPMIFEKRLVGLADYGVSALIQNQGYYTELLFHNGEGLQAERDRNIWITSRWGFQNSQGLQIQVSAQAGQTSPEATVNGSTDIGRFDPNDSSKWRTAAMHIKYSSTRFNWITQYTMGDVRQTDHKGRYVSVQMDGIYRLQSGLGFGARLDTWDPELAQKDNRIIKTSGLLVLSDAHRNSSVVMIFSKVTEEGHQIPNDEFRISWHLTPLAFE